MNMALSSTPTASVITVKCGCPGNADTQLVDLEAIGITIHCPSCGGVVVARFASLPLAIAYLTKLAEETGYIS